MLEETIVVGGAMTTAPPARPRWMESNPIWERTESPSRRVARLTASWPASSRSGGSEVPGSRLPERMRPRSPATTASTAVGGWATIPPLAQTRTQGTRYWSDQNVAAFCEGPGQLSIGVNRCQSAASDGVTKEQGRRHEKTPLPSNRERGLRGRADSDCLGIARFDL